MKKCKSFIVLILLLIIVLSACSNESSKTCQHQWIEADCLHPRTCKICNKTEGVAWGHVGKWVITSESTLNRYGTETLICTSCNETINRSIPMKKPSLQRGSFNFAVDEFIDWLNNNSRIRISKTDLGLSNNMPFYSIVSANGKKGIICFGYDSDNNFVVRMNLLFDDYATAVDTALYIVKEIAPEFDAPADAATLLLNGYDVGPLGITMQKLVSMYGYDAHIKISTP